MIQFDAFRKYLATFVSVPPTEWLHLVSVLRLRHLEKGEYYFKQGQKFDEIGFVVKGLLCGYYVLDNGKQTVKKFFAEGEPVSCYADLIMGTPADFSCQTLEPTTLITLKYSELQNLYKRHACWEKMGRISAEKIFIEKEQRTRSYLTMRGRGRYIHFCNRNPALVERIPQYLIASYLGITAVALSRAKNQTTTSTRN